MAASLPRILVPRDQMDLRAGNMFEPALNPSQAERVRAPCARGQGLDADAVLFLDRTNASLHSVEGCVLAMVDRTPHAIEELLKAIRLRIEVEPIPQDEPAPIADRATPQDTLERSKQHLADLRDPISKQLAHALEEHLGRKDLDSATFVRAILKTFDVDVGGQLREQLQSGAEVQFDLREPESLRPGDLVFYVSYGYVPKVVVLYLGQGLIAEVADVRGVVVSPLPVELPWFFQAVARRPLTDAP
jgi:hypothetical protein